MMAYISLSTGLLASFISWTISNIDRSINHWDDALSKLATSLDSKVLDLIYIKEITWHSTKEPWVCCVSTPSDWRTPLIEHIMRINTPWYKVEVRRIPFKARNYCMINNQLHTRSLVEPLLRCIIPEETATTMSEVHSSICGEHLTTKSTTLKIIRHGVF